MIGENLFKFEPTEIPITGELKPVEVALIKSVKNLEMAMVRISAIWITALVIIGGMWAAGGYLFAQKLDEYSATVKTTVQMEVEIRNLKDRVSYLELVRGK